MRHCRNEVWTDWANALRSRVLFVLFAILALGATPLGAGELIAAESYLVERNKLETRSGGLPTRFAVTPADASVAEFLDPLPAPDSSLVLLHDTSEFQAPPSVVRPDATGRILRALPLVGRSPSLARAQGARAPPAS